MLILKLTQTFGEQTSTEALTPWFYGDLLHATLSLCWQR